MRNPTQYSWHCMMRRCYEPGHNRFYSYGAKGVTVCERWHTYANFLADMGERPEGCTLGRHGDQGNYEPGNVSWQTTSEQAKRGEANHVAKLTQEQADCMRSLHQRYVKNGCSGRNMSRELGLSKGQVSAVLNYRSYT